MDLWIQNEPEPNELHLSLRYWNATLARIPYPWPVGFAGLWMEAARVETSVFSDLLADRVDLVPGTKGSGKSVLYRRSQLNVRVSHRFGSSVRTRTYAPLVNKMIPGTYQRMQRTGMGCKSGWSAVNILLRSLSNLWGAETGPHQPMLLASLEARLTLRITRRRGSSICCGLKCRVDHFGARFKLDAQEIADLAINAVPHFSD